MLLRKILTNLLAACLTPIVLSLPSLPDLYNAVFHQQYEYYDFRIESLDRYLYFKYGQIFIPLFIVSLFFFFFPFQLIKDIYRRDGDSRMLTFLGKWLLLTLIILASIVFFGLFTNIWWTSPLLYKNLFYIIYAAGFGLIFTTFFHYTLDRYERNEARPNKDQG